MIDNERKAYYEEMGRHFQDSKNYSEVLIKIKATFNNWLAEQSRKSEQQEENQLNQKQDSTDGY